MNIPEQLVLPAMSEQFREEYWSRREHGNDVLHNSKIAVVGLARNCESSLRNNLARAAMLTGGAVDYRLLIVENDSTDGTKDVAKEYCEIIGDKGHAITRDLGRKSRPAEFAGPRTVELAEYRSECQEWVRRNFDEADYVIVIDWDAMGGWIHNGAMTGLSYLATEQDAYGVASVSLTQHPMKTYNQQTQEVSDTLNWLHYDCWALRLNSYWDDYSSGQGGWKHSWLPPVGSPPVRVMSAFGGFAIYKAEQFLKGSYSGEDCEHVCFHRSIQETGGGGLYLNPSQRTVMNVIHQDAKQGSSKHLSG